MNRYISEIRINNLYHLNDISIRIADENYPHLILTGKNGSGKTVLLNAIADYLEKIKTDADACSRKQGSIDIAFYDAAGLVKDYNEGNFIIAFYEAARNTKIIEPKSPTKPELSPRGNTRTTLTTQLLNFLSDLKIQEALARNEGKNEDADEIKSWLENFVNILRDLFEDKELKLEFNYRDYTFRIVTKGKSFKFTELSDGFIAALDIIADLILKMQPEGGLSGEFSKPGIVLIDEIETHLHLKLQKAVLPMLVALFPNIQFIVTSHSPFVLSSLPNATAYDLENHEPITNLTEYSYQALTEGYFGVSTDSDYARRRYEELERLLKKESLSDAERITARQLIDDYRKIPEATSPELVGAYRHLEIMYNGKIKSLSGNDQNS